MDGLVTAYNFERLSKYWSLFAQGLFCTVALSALSVFFGFILALALSGMRLSSFRPLSFLGRTKDGLIREDGFLAALSRFNPLSAIATAYVEFFRATPLMVQVLVIYLVVFGYIFTLPKVTVFGFLALNRFIPSVVALSMNSGAYLCEIIRAGIQSIDGGQTEAARSLGLSQMQNMRFIILPQAVKNILPAIANEFVTIIKESAICYTVGVQDIMYAVNVTRGSLYIAAEPLIVATVMYFCLTFPTSKIIAHFERRMSRGDKR